MKQKDRRFLRLVVAMVGLLGGLAAWHWNPAGALAAHCTGLTNRVAIPDIGEGLSHDQVLVTTGRTGNAELTTCNSVPLSVARFGVLTGQSQEHYDKHHWQHDPGKGVKLSCFAGLGSCVVGSTEYSLYDVQEE